MKRTKAIFLLGDTVSAAAAALEVSQQAVAKWPPVLPRRIADRVLGAYMRKAMPGVVDSLLREAAASEHTGAKSAATH